MVSPISCSLMRNYRKRKMVNISPRRKGIQIPESGYFFACGIRNPTNDWNPEIKFHGQSIWITVTRIRNPQGGIQNPTMSWIPLHRANYSVRIHRLANNNSQVFRSITDKFLICLVNVLTIITSE